MPRKKEPRSPRDYRNHRNARSRSKFPVADMNARDPDFPGLTVTQAQWVHHFLTDAKGNATEAARLCGFRDDEGRRAMNIGAEMLAHEGVREVVAARLDAQVMTEREILHRLSEMARGVPEDCWQIDEHGNGRIDLNRLRERGLLHLVRGLKPTANGIQIVVESSKEALEVMARLRGMFNDRKTIALEIDWKNLPAPLLDDLLEGRIKPEELPKRALAYAPSTVVDGNGAVAEVVAELVDSDD